VPSVFLVDTVSHKTSTVEFDSAAMSIRVCHEAVRGKALLRYISRYMMREALLRYLSRLWEEVR